MLAAAPVLAQERAERPAAPQPPSPGVLRLLPRRRGQRERNRRWRTQAPLYRDRRHAAALRPERRAHCGGVLYGLCGERRSEPAGHLRVQRRTGRGLRLSASRARRSAHHRFRPGRPRRRRRQVARQSADVARIHRPRDDRSGRDRLEPPREIRRRQRILGRAARRGGAREGHRALCRAQQPRRIAEIPARRELRRLPRRQGRARAAARAGHRRLRHHHGVALHRGRVPVGRRPLCARRGAALPGAGRDRARAQRERSTTRRWRRPSASQ